MESASTRRVALVIGNTSYAGRNLLKNPANDATAIAAALRDAGFDVLLRLDRTTEQMDGDVAEFSKKLSEDTVALFYYSGHGAQVAGDS